MKEGDTVVYVRRGEKLPAAGTRVCFSSFLEITPDEISVNGYKIVRTEAGYSVRFPPGGQGGGGPNAFNLTEQEFERLAKLAKDLHKSFGDAIRELEKSKPTEEFWREP